MREHKRLIDCKRLSETITDYERALETDGDCKRLSETIRDYGRL